MKKAKSKSKAAAVKSEPIHVVMDRAEFHKNVGTFERKAAWTLLPITLDDSVQAITRHAIQARAERLRA